MSFQFKLKGLRTVTTAPPTSLFTPIEPATDLVAEHLREQSSPADMKAMLRLASQASGLPPHRISSDIIRLGRGDGQLHWSDYFMYQLYDPRQYSSEAKANFVSDRIHWPIANKCCDITWRAATEDKWLAASILDRLGARTPTTLAVLDRSSRAFGQTRRITTAPELHAFLRTASFPIFAKPNGEMGSFGAFVIHDFHDGHVVLDQGRTPSVDDLFAHMLGGRTYLLQAVLQNHPALQPYARHLATVRTMNLVGRDGVSTPFTLLKLPAGENVADNYWRQGNLIADLDPETGVIRRAVSGKGAHLREHEAHPESGLPLLGLQMPMWSEVRSLNEACARAFAPVRYQSLDIAITPEGPVVVEINSGASFALPQIASGRGFLMPEVRDFFQSCGWRFKGR